MSANASPKRIRPVNAELGNGIDLRFWALKTHIINIINITQGPMIFETDEPPLYLFSPVDAIIYIKINHGAIFTNSRFISAASSDPIIIRNSVAAIISNINAAKCFFKGRLLQPLLFEPVVDMSVSSLTNYYLLHQLFALTIEHLDSCNISWPRRLNRG